MSPLSDEVFSGCGLSVFDDDANLAFYLAFCVEGFSVEMRLPREEVFRLRDALQLWLEETHEPGESDDERMGF